MLFTRLIENSLESCALILAVLIITLLMRHKVKIYSYILWILVFVWILMPVHVPTPAGILPGISLEDILGAGAPDIVPDGFADSGESQNGDGGEKRGDGREPETGDGEKEDAQQSVGGDEGKEDAQQGIAGDEGKEDAQQSRAEGEGKEFSFLSAVARWILPEGRIFQILFGIWILGAALMGCRGAWGAVRLQRSLRRAVRCEQFGIKDVFQSDGIEVPIVSGFFHPGIYLPKVSLEPYQQLYILEHEQMHIRRKDFLVKAIAYGVLCLHWFNPLVWLAFVQLEQSMEFSCDEAVLRRLGEGQKKEYSRTLLTMAAGGFSQREKGVFSLGFLENNTRERIRNILEYEYHGRWATMAASVVLIGCFICFFGGVRPLLAEDERGMRQETGGVGIGRWKDEGKGHGTPAVVVDEDGNIIGTCRGKELKNLVLNYANEMESEFSGQENRGEGYRIEEGAFSACGNMEKLIVENSQDITYVAENAFQGCYPDLEVYCGRDTYLWKRLKKLGIACVEYSEGSSVEDLLDWGEGIENIEGKISGSLSGEEEETVENSYITSEVVTIEDPDQDEMQGSLGSPYFIMTDKGRLIGTGGSLLEEATSLNEGVELPSEAKSMDQVFSQANTVIQANIPAGMEEIGDHAYSQSFLHRLVFEGQNGESRLKKIGASAFAECDFSGSPRLVIPEGVTEIGARAFSDCEGLEEIVLPKSLRKIGSGCFAGCVSLKKVTVNSANVLFDSGNPAVATDDIFYHCGVEYIEKENRYTKSKMILYGPKGSTAEKYAAGNKIKYQGLE